ncbi:hypothetical protein BDV40DRAFT_263056 [Aspergillus tamarii]|uniref:Uncharacterized protein n=1 Tax=Aspergillus tamarii TaxID=41984 RepID=A0A5N6UXG8_ASPTM|nr:hypothetical protein BDV40DRAFT_263056 [Aspergillus tamarii]
MVSSAGDPPMITFCELFLESRVYHLDDHLGIHNKHGSCATIGALRVTKVAQDSSLSLGLRAMLVPVAFPSGIYYYWIRHYLDPGSFQGQ